MCTRSHRSCYYNDRNERHLCNAKIYGMGKQWRVKALTGGNPTGRLPQTRLTYRKNAKSGFNGCVNLRVAKSLKLIATWPLSNSSNKLHFMDMFIFVEALNLRGRKGIRVINAILSINYAFPQCRLLICGDSDGVFGEL